MHFFLSFTLKHVDAKLMHLVVLNVLGDLSKVHYFSASVTPGDNSTGLPL